MVLFMPDVTFIIQIFAAAHKSRAAVALSQAYCHISFYSPEYTKRIFDVVQSGLEQYDWDKIRPFLILFQHMLETANQSPTFGRAASKWLQIFFGRIV